jgi:hypothetical protein
MKPFETLQDWKSKPYQRTNYENIHAFYGDQKYIRMKPKTHITLTPGLLHLIIKHPKEWVHQNFKLEEEVTLHNETHNILYYTLIDSLISDEEKELKLHVKNGIPKEDEEWRN